MDAYQQLEHEFGRWIGNPNTVACNSGTAALHLALEAMRLPRGLVLVPEFTMIACARAVTLAGLDLEFIDCKDDLNLDEAQLVDKAMLHTRAIMAVHIYGRRCNMDAITRFAKFNGNGTEIRVIEDLAEAHGVTPHPDTDAACWSFYRNKIVAGEEGGMIAFKDPRHAEYARMLRSLGATSSNNYYHLPRGMNYRLANLLAAPILRSLDWVSYNLAARQRVCDWYDELVPAEWKMPKRDVVWVYDLRIPGMTTMYQDALVHELLALNVAARHGFQPMSLQAEYQRYTRPDLNAKRLAQEVIYLPVTPTLHREDVQRHVDRLTCCWDKVSHGM